MVGSAEIAAPRRPPSRVWLAVVLVCATLLGQGERYHVDPRFGSPGATLETYWGAIRQGDMITVAECFTEPAASLPFPGMLWFLPPVDDLRITSIRVVSAESRRIATQYEVRFLPSGSKVEERFVTSSDLQRVGHEWRIVPPRGEASMPEWTPYPRPVDI